MKNIYGTRSSRFIALLLLMPLTGCQTLSKVIDQTQPKYPYQPQTDHIFTIDGASEITLKAPMKTTILPDGTTETEPIYQEVTEELPIFDGEGKFIQMKTIMSKRPVVPSLKLKDPNVRPPTTWVDGFIATADKIFRGFLMYWGVKGAVNIANHGPETVSPVVVDRPGPTRIFVPQGPSETLGEVG